MRKVAEQNELVLLKDLEEIVTHGAEELATAADQQIDTDTSSTQTYTPSFSIPRSIATIVPVGVFFYNIITVNGQTCSDGVAIAASSFTGPCLNATSANGLPAFNIAIKVTSGSSYLYDKIAHLYGIWPTSTQPGLCGLLIKNTCDVIPSLSGMPTWQLASWTAAQQTSITIMGMGTLANCTNAANGYFRDLVSCLYSTTTDFLRNLPTPPANDTTPTPNNSAQPGKDGFNPRFIMGICLLGASFLVLAAFSALIYRKCKRRPEPTSEVEAREPLASAEEGESADNNESMAEKMSKFSKTAKGAATPKTAGVGGQRLEHDHDKMFQL